MSGTLGLLISVLYSTIYEFDFPIIPTVNFPQNEWFDSTNNKFLTNSNYKNAIVNDELTLKLNFTNNKDFTITIIPELKLSVENSIQFKKYEQIIINPNKSNVTNIQFLLTEEGTNHVNLTANVFYTNGTIIDKIDAPITLQVVSLNSKPQHDSNAITLKATIISAVIGAITISALTINLFFTRKQNKNLIDNSLEDRRPWISITDNDPAFVIYPNSVEIGLKNYGKTPAIIIDARGLISEQAISSEILQSSKSLYDVVDDSSVSMAPTEIWSEPILCPDELKNKLETLNEFYFGLYLKYKYYNKIAVTELLVKKHDNEFTYVRKKLS